MDFGLERTAVGLCSRLEVLQDVIIEITNQYVRHSRVNLPYARWYHSDTGWCGILEQVVTAGSSTDSRTRGSVAGSPGHEAKRDRQGPRARTARANSWARHGPINERPQLSRAIERGVAEERWRSLPAALWDGPDKPTQRIAREGDCDMARPVALPFAEEDPDRRERASPPDRGTRGRAHTADARSEDHGQRLAHHERARLR